MATITQSVQKKTRTSIELTPTDIVEMFRKAHPDLAVGSIGLLIKSDYRLDLHGDSPQKMEDMHLIIVTETVEES